MRARRKGPVQLRGTTVDAVEMAEEAAAPVKDAAVHVADVEPLACGEDPRPVRSPPVLMLVVDDEEEVELCLPPPANDLVDPDVAPNAVDPTEMEPPFDPPDLDDLLGAGDDEPGQETFDAIAGEDPVEVLLNIELEDDEEEPPFDPIGPEDLEPVTLSAPLASGPAEIVPQAANDSGRGAALGPARDAVPERAREQPAPAIRIHLSWDRPDGAAFFERVAADARLARAEIAIARGGLDGAAMRCASREPPDLLVIETTLRGAAMLASIDRLIEAAGDGTRIIVLGGVNDVTLLREMAQRGVDEYLVWPAKPEDVAGSACAMFAGADKARVIAVLGARGGIGASTIAQNIAWSIAERQRVRTTLVDLDLPFGSAAFNLKLEPQRTLGDVLSDGVLDDAALERVATRRSERLTLLAAPADPHWPADLATDTAQALVAAVRRLSSYVVLDVPHGWDPWIKQALLGADQIVLVASPDIASLRNADNIAKRIKDEHKVDPIVVLSMTGVPKRPEVPLKEFAEALGIAPECAFAFEPNLFGAASLTGQIIGEIAPRSMAAGLFDQLATLLTGREPVEEKPAKPARAKPLPVVSAVEHPPADPFETALVNPIALMAAEDLPESLNELPPLELLEPASVTPDYLTCARAAALDNLHAIESLRRPPRPSISLGPVASATMGFVITALGAGAYLFMQLQTAPAPAAASTAIAPQTSASHVARPTLQDMIDAFDEALGLIERGAAAEAAARLQRLANAGFAPAQYRLAKLYEHGEGVALDLGHARQWTERAAMAGVPEAMHDLGVYYARGEGVPRDETAAFRWFHRAAELGVIDSQFNLATLYQQGRGTETNHAEALFWFMLAAQAGDETAAERVTALRNQVTPFEIERADARLSSFARTGSAAGAAGTIPTQPSSENTEIQVVPPGSGG